MQKPKVGRVWAASGFVACAIGCGSDPSAPGLGDAGEANDTSDVRSVDATGSPSADRDGAAQLADATVAAEAASEGDAMADVALDDVGSIRADATETGRLSDAVSGAESSTEAEAGPGGCSPHCGDVTTWHNDLARTGQNLEESVLSPINVDFMHFGKLFVLNVDGKVDAQPLVVSAVSLPGKGVHDVVYVATEHDSLYAFDAQSSAGANATPLWYVSLLPAGSAETPSEARYGCGQVTPEIGVTSTPVIDLATHTLYTVSMTRSGNGAAYFQRLHAIDIASGAERAGSPVDIQATYPGTGANANNGQVVFDPGQYKERAGLVLANGSVVLSWASHCDVGAYTGWIMTYDASTLRQTAVLNVTPNGSDGAIWASGAAPAVDGDGNLYLLDANGTFDSATDTNGLPAQKDFGNGFLKIGTKGSLAVIDFFEAWDTAAESSADTDLGSGGAMVLPDGVGSAAHPHLSLGAGKDGNIYLVDRDNMGKYSPLQNNPQIVQQLTGAVSGGVFASPAYFGAAIYYGDVNGTIKRFPISAGQMAASPSAQTTTVFGYPGATPSISALGSAGAAAVSTGIVWAAENRNPAVLHAYEAITLREIYASTQAPGGRDSFGAGNKYIVPTVAHGRVYVASTNGVGVFGHLQ